MTGSYTVPCTGEYPVTAHAMHLYMQKPPVSAAAEMGGFVFCGNPAQFSIKIRETAMAGENLPRHIAFSILLPGFRP